MGIRKIETPLLEMFLKAFLFAHFKMQIFYLNILTLQHLGCSLQYLASHSYNGQNLLSYRAM